MSTKHQSDRAMEALAEADYIASIDPHSPGSTFNHDPECFQRYRAMQSKKHEEFPKITQSMLASV